MNYRGGRDRDNSGFEETVVRVNRVAKVVKGGKRFSFSALVVVGDRKGKVGFAIGKAGEVPEAIRKAVEQAKKNLVTVPMVGKTIPHSCRCRSVRPKYCSSRLRRVPALLPVDRCAPCSNLRAFTTSLPSRLASNNPINVVLATIEGLRSLKTAEKVAELRGKTTKEIFSVAN